MEFCDISKALLFSGSCFLILKMGKDNVAWFLKRIKKGIRKTYIL